MSVEHTYIVEKGTETKTITKAKAIRAHCMDCAGWMRSEVSKCTCRTCALYPFRFGNEKGLDRMYFEKTNEEKAKEKEQQEEDEWEAEMEAEEE